MFMCPGSKVTLTFNLVNKSLLKKNGNIDICIGNDALDKVFSI